MQPNLSMVLEQVGKDKGIDKKVLVQTLEQAIMTAAKKVFGLEREMEAQFNEDSGQVDLFQVCIVTDSVDVKGRDIAKVDADRNGLRADIGDELLFQITKHGVGKVATKVVFCPCHIYKSISSPN